MFNWDVLFRVAKVSLSVFGGVFELIGVLMMSRRYINVGFLHGLQGLFSALWRGETANEIANIETLTREDVLLSLQGLSLIGIGFISSSAANILSAF
jgi:hypothetical protein